MKKAIAIPVLLAGISAAGYAQESKDIMISDLQAQGAKPLTKDEVAVLFKGATVYWTSRTWSDNQLKFAEDGSLVGSYVNRTRSAKGYPVSGTWKVADDGKLCRTIVIRGQSDDYCSVVFKLGDKYYQGTKNMIELQISK